MPTLRNEFNIEQFRTVFQGIAHKIAIEAITNLRGTVRIVVHAGKLDTVDTDKHQIHFYAHHISYSEPSGSYDDYFGFDVEEKLYAASSHSTKISFYAPEGKEKKLAEKITEFINKIMADAEIKPVPRFSLKSMAH